jgi:hypothetical protein
MHQRLLPALLSIAAAGAVFAKLPVPPQDEAAKAKSAETAAKAAWQAKADAFQLCQSQDKLGARYGKKGGGAGTPATPPCADPGPYVSTAAPAAPAAPAASAASAPASAAK